MKKRKLIEVEWHDSASLHRWRQPDAHQREAKTVNCVSVGWETKRTSDSITLTQTVSEDNELLDSISIPRGCIRRVKRV